MSFVHLHAHSQYSLLDGFVDFKRLLGRAKEYGMPAVALTDHGNMFGAVEFFKQAREAEIKPIIGCEVYLTSGSRHDRSREAGRTHHLILLAKDLTGYQNLCRLVSRAYFEGFYYKPRIDHELLKAHAEGLIGTTSCLAGEVPSLILAGMEDRAKEKLQQYRDSFAEGDFYVELQNHGIPEEERVMPVLQQFAKDLSLPLIATNDCHYVDREDASVHDIMLCVQCGKSIDDQERIRFHNDQFYFKSTEEMRDAFVGCDEALKNTLAVADKIDFNFKFGDYLFPSFQLPKETTLDSYLGEQAKKGLAERMPRILATHKQPVDQQAVEEEYAARLQMELEVIIKMGFSGYFLIVADFIAYAKDKGIPVGPGRGSAAGSLVAYALRITDIDPIPYQLLFERFLNPERISMPDIDIDFCIRGRDDVIRYVADKYGGASGEIHEAKVAQIITFGKLKARAVIRDVGRVLNMSYGEVDRIAKLVPFSINIKLAEAFEQEPRFAEMRQKEPMIDKLLCTAEALEGFVRHASTHAAGVVISDDRPLVDHMPLVKGNEGEISTQYDMKMVEALGLIKFDFLGLKTLTVLQRCVELVKQNHGVGINLEALDLDDAETYHLLSKGATTGIFQLESSGMRDIIRRLKPGKFEDIIALVALYRPGPLGSGMVDDFIERKHGLKPIVYELPELEEILEETYGVILYQEQVMQIAVKLANYSMADADILRKAMGKKIAQVMFEQKERFMSGAAANKVPTAKAAKIFDLIVQFGGYGFNKSHSTAYALISYQTAYLKAHYPVEFMTALLSEDLHNTDKVISYILDCQEQGIEVLSPNVNSSTWDFAALDERIRFGLGAVKNVGEGAADAISAARQSGGDFTDVFDFFERVDLNSINRKVLEALVKCGALDDFKLARAPLFAALDQLIDYGQAHQRQRASGQVGLFDSATLEKPQNFFPDVEEWEDKVKLSFEKESVGFYLNGHPLNKYESLIERLGCVNLEHVHTLSDKKHVLVGGMVAAMKEITSKSGKRMAFVTLEDLKGTIECVVFSDTYLTSVELLKSGEPLCVRATIDAGEDKNKLLVNRIAPLVEAETALGLKVYLKLTKKHLDDSKLAVVKETLARYPGKCPTYIDLQLEDGRVVTMSLPEKSWIKPEEELFSALDKLSEPRGAISVEVR